eukprot:Lithocolla_globosa_v1_NODE_2129_length_2152_cov_6.161183.p2 type:complete len:102 gc:universal NODE_2129_length_2152_cov_6.161183:1611-1306(-)
MTKWISNLLRAESAIPYCQSFGVLTSQIVTNGSSRVRALHKRNRQATSRIDFAEDHISKSVPRCFTAKKEVDQCIGMPIPLGFHCARRHHRNHDRPDSPFQ